MRGFRAGKFERETVPAWARGLCPAHSSLSLLDIDPNTLAHSGKKLVLIDVDNTLLPWGKNEQVPQSSLDWVAQARSCGLEICILSNTRHPARLERIAGKLGVSYLRGKFKPSTTMYRQALKEFGLQPAQAVMIGDQLFTDILGANRAGIEAIWVRPMTSKDFVGTKVSRMGERIVRGALYRGLPPSSEDEPEEDLPPGGAGAVELLKKPIVRQFVKFCIVGASSTIIDVGLGALLLFVIPVGNETFGTYLGSWLMQEFPAIFGGFKKPVNAATPIINVFSAGVAILNAFYWNRRWTFDIRDKEGRIAQLHKFVVVALLGMLWNTIITTALFNVVPGHPKRSWAIAKAIATVIVAFWNFGGQKLWTFRKRHP